MPLDAKPHLAEEINPESFNEAAQLCVQSYIELQKRNDYDGNVCNSSWHSPNSNVF